MASLIPGLPRFLWGLSLMPLVAFTKDWRVLTVELVAAALLLLLSGKKIRPLARLFFILSVILFSLLNPRGLILWEWGWLRITEDALEDGLRRSLSILTLLFISGFSVSASLRLPGRFGSLLSGVFSSLLRLMEGKKNFDKKDWVGSIDRILLGVLDPLQTENDSTSPLRAQAQRTDAPQAARLGFLPWGIGLMCLSLCGAAAACLITRL